MKVIVVNSGSSSIKYKVFPVDGGGALVEGLLERIGSPEARLKHRRRRDPGGGSPPARDQAAWNEAAWDEVVESRKVADHRAGLDFILEVAARLPAAGDPEVFGFGHRVVHGGEAFREPVVIDDRAIEQIRQLIPLAPLHNPANLAAIEVLRGLRPGVPNVAVFDTAFHQTMPPRAFHYALPEELYTSHQVRRYGFHGSSHGFVAGEASRHLGIPAERLNLITLHLGNGASAAAVEGGRSVDTSMGLTPLEGLIMGTRCGDLDPAVPFYLARRTGQSYEEIERRLNHESGLKGICGVNDLREIEQRAGAGDARATLALEMFCYRVRKYIGAYLAALGRVDAIVFTGGIGENSVRVRRDSCVGLAGLGIELDEARNRQAGGGIREIQADSSRVKLLVIPTDEEGEIARQTVAAIRRAGTSG